MAKFLVCPAGRLPFRIPADNVNPEAGWNAADLQAAVEAAVNDGTLRYEPLLASDVKSILLDPPACGGPDAARQLSLIVWDRLQQKLFSEFIPYLHLVIPDNGDGKPATLRVPDGYTKALCRRLAARMTADPQGASVSAVPEAFLRYLAKATWRVCFLTRQVSTGRWEACEPTLMTRTEFGPVWINRTSLCFPAYTFEPIETRQPAPAYMISGAEPDRIPARIALWTGGMFAHGAGLDKNRTKPGVQVNWNLLCEPQWRTFLKSAQIDLCAVSALETREMIETVVSRLIDLALDLRFPNRQRSLQRLETYPGWALYKHFLSLRR